jgi:apolipoprotein N-acyltransferase
VPVVRLQVKGEAIVRLCCFEVYFPEVPVGMARPGSDFLLTSPYNHGTVGSSQNGWRDADHQGTEWRTASLQEKNMIR